MRQLAASHLTYGSKSRSHSQRKYSITKSRLHLTKLRNLTLSAAISDSAWIGIAIEYRKHDEIEIAFAYNNGRHHSGHVTHRVRIPSMLEHAPSTFLGPLSYGSDAASFVCEHILNAVKYFQLSNDYKYHGAGLSEEVVRLSPELPSRLWLDLDIVPITTTCAEHDAWSTSSGRSSVSMLSISSSESEVTSPGD